MTNARANEIFCEKYPTGCIYPHPTISGRYSVVYKAEGKVYDYCAESYAQLLNRLGFPVITRSGIAQYKVEIDRLTRKIEEGKEESLFVPGGWMIFSDEDKAKMRKRINQIEKLLGDAIVA